jgi:hypothetical protein
MDILKKSELITEDVTDALISISKGLPPDYDMAQKLQNSNDPVTEGLAYVHEGAWRLTDDGKRIIYISIMMAKLNRGEKVVIENVPESALIVSGIIKTI